jgi:hypothetical protein
MKQFIVRQTVDLDLQWLIEAESVQDALEKAWGNFDISKVVDICPLDWDKPWDAEEVQGEAPSFLSAEELHKWQELGLL